jgi:hypothetical protein
MEKIEFQDKTLTCKLCGGQFIWLAGEQEFYHDRGLSQPTKCKSCRDSLKRKLHRQGQAREVQHE